MLSLRLPILLAAVCCASASVFAAPLSFLDAPVVTPQGRLSDQADTAITVLQEEAGKRTGTAVARTGAWPASGPVIAAGLAKHGRIGGQPIPASCIIDRPEGYGLLAAESEGRPVLWIVGADERGLLFGIGDVLRTATLGAGRFELAGPLARTTAPEYGLRGHQLGFRTRANSWDAWTVAEFDQHIRELALFGTNAIENIPFQDEDPGTLMKVSRDEMNVAMSRICAKYGLEHWIWMPAEFDLADTAQRSALLDRNEAFYRDVPRLDGVFFPGGDPGSNHPEFVMPFLADLAKRLARHHPDAKIWVSLQGFDDPQVDYFYNWIEAEMPDWFGGLVSGPSSPSIPESRARLPKVYKHRSYPDITHTVRSQYPSSWMDPAYAHTLGREPVNPEPVRYSFVHNVFAPYTDGFLTYSDGVHDDVNKLLWSRLGWDSTLQVRDILAEYGRFFFGPEVAERSADGILALERNWDGGIEDNGGVEATLALWRSLEEEAPALAGNWRWQMCLMRAYYDAYTRHRLIYEERLEDEALAALGTASFAGAAAAGASAKEILARAETAPVRPDLRDRVVALCDDLFRSVALQTSVEKYQASGKERGAVLDYLDYPLNDRRWLEDVIDGAMELGDEAARIAMFEKVRAWEHPGPGSFYDEVGNVGKSPRVVRPERWNTDPNNDRGSNPDFMWVNEGDHRHKQAWISKLDWPVAVRYEGLDRDAVYVVRATGYGDCFVRGDGVRLVPTQYDKELGGLKEFSVPSRLISDGLLVLTFDVPFEPGINWRQQSRLGEIWLLKQ